MFCLLHVIVLAIAFAAPLCFSKLRRLEQPAHASSCLCLVMEAALFKTSLICPCLLSPPKAHYLDKVVKGMALLLSYLFFLSHFLSSIIFPSAHPSKSSSLELRSYFHSAHASCLTNTVLVESCRCCTTTSNALLCHLAT